MVKCRRSGGDYRDLYAGRTLPELVATAITSGLNPATPAIAVERATRADERVIAGTIADLPEKLAAEPPSGPVVVMIGRVFGDYVAAAAQELPADLLARSGPA